MKKTYKGVEYDSQEEIVNTPSLLMIKTGKNKKTGKNQFKNALNLNFYRNAHYIFNDRAKKEFKEIISPQINALKGYSVIRPVYRYWLARKADIGNVHSVVEKYFLDALVETGKIKDDSCNDVLGADYEFMGIDRENPRCEIEIKELKYTLEK